jgi:hypothetical protein
VNALGWILRIILLLILLRFVLRLLFPNRRPARPTRPRSVPERSGGELVRDPQCGTYIPKVSALTLNTGDGIQYFCSATCRDAYTAGRRSASRDTASAGR